MSSNKFKPDEWNLKSFSLMGPESGGPSLVESTGGRITRIRPYEYDRDYTDKNCNPWKIEARGSVFVPPNNVALSVFGLAYKTRVYSKNRVKYPLKRVDWDPNGERNPQNRGKSKYVRISWDEAAQIVADELRRIKDKYGMSAVLCQADMHGEGKNVSPSHGCPNRLLSLLGGYTIQIRNMDSWEGWYWGAKHVWGCEPVGEMMPMTNLWPDIAKHSDMLLYWGCDQETTPLGFGSCISSRLSYWLTEIGIKSVYICPDLNYGAAVHADKWIPVLPNTDVALQLAIAYMWITEGTYEKEYIATHAHGFDKFEDYVLGREDGVPKTPEWASEKCGVPEWTIKALARAWAKKITSIIHGNGGSYIRGPYASEPARMEAMLLGMRALGSPGVHQAKMLEFHMWNRHYMLPFEGEFVANVPHICDALRPVDEDVKGDIKFMRFFLNDEQKKRAPQLEYLFEKNAAPLQGIPRTLIHRAILEDHIEWYGMQVFSTAQVPDKDGKRRSTNEFQFKKMQFPRPGMSRLHMIWTDAPCQQTCWNDGNMFARAMQSPEIEFIVAQHPWMENDCCYADIILPVATKYEMPDISNDNLSGVFTSVYLEHPSCPPVGESVSDFDAVARVAEKLGQEYFDAYTGKLTEDDRVRLFYKASGCEERMSWEEFNQRRIFVIPCFKDAQDLPPGMREFFLDPENHPLTTPTGKLEFCSTNIEKYMPDDPERPPVPHWVEKSESHDERLTGDRAKKYPLLCMSNHGRWRMHAQCDDIIWSREVETMKIKGPDGYLYEPLWLSRAEADKRGIKHGDIVKVYNERGIVLAAAYITERLIGRTCYIDHGARCDPIIPGWLDRGGAINLITPTAQISKNSSGMATSGFLVEVEKVTEEEMAGWKRDYPEAFARKYDKACGLCLEGWLADGQEA
ncbi:MAG: molybdopterin-dependent oxidoreductase [Oscillospiraceae bacterium]|nr:molybdopterin-dependent oxidoreductase [Oscillospiraceae bacterium]